MVLGNFLYFASIQHKASEPHPRAEVNVHFTTTPKSATEDHIDMHSSTDYDQ